MSGSVYARKVEESSLFLLLHAERSHSTDELFRRETLLAFLPLRSA